MSGVRTRLRFLSTVCYNMLASLEARLVQNVSLTGVKCRAASVAKKEAAEAIEVRGVRSHLR